VWFTAPSTRWPLTQVRYDGMESQPTGRLLSHDPRTGETVVRLDELMFANGVTLSPDEDYVLVNEWSGYRITRLWLDDEKDPPREVFYENLPGFPDNISLDPRGFYWVGLVIERSALLDWLHSRPFLMKVLPRIPEAWQPQLPPFGWLLAIDEQGRVLHNLQDSTERVFRVTGARRHGEDLYLTSDLSHTLARLPAPRKERLARTKPRGASQ
jgi:sugar lactone lactonase YvrE